MKPQESKSVWEHSQASKTFSQDIEIFINEERLYAQGMDGVKLHYLN